MLILGNIMNDSNQTNGPSIIGDALLEAIIRQAVWQKIVQTGSSKHETSEDRLLTVEEAAQMLSMSTDWLYRNAKKLPFARKLGKKALRFSQQGMLKWLEKRKPN